MENIELSQLDEKLEMRLLNAKKDGSRPPISKPAYSTRNVLNIFNNNDLLKKIESLKNTNNKIIISNNKHNNNHSGDLSNSKAKIRINVAGTNKENNTYQDLFKKNITTSHKNVLNVNSVEPAKN